MGLIIERCGPGQREDLFSSTASYTLAHVLPPPGLQSHTVSPLDATDKLARNFSWCIAVLLAGTDDIGYDISALLHVVPGLQSGESPMCPVRQICQSLVYALLGRARRETVVAGYAGGSAPKSPGDDSVRASVYSGLVQAVREYIPLDIPFVQLSEPKRIDIGDPVTDVYYRTQERRVVIRQ